MLTDEQIKRYYEFKKTKRTSYSKLIGDKSPKVNIGETERLNPLFNGCEAFKSMMHIDSSGDIYPCITCSSVGIGKIGNAITMEREQLWNSNEIEKIRKVRMNHFEVCNNCDINSVCNFKCMALSYAKTSSMTSCGIPYASRKLCELQLNDPIPFSNL